MTPRDDDTSDVMQIIAFILGQNERPSADMEAGGWCLLVGVGSSGAGGFDAGSGVREECCALSVRVRVH